MRKMLFSFKVFVAFLEMSKKKIKQRERYNKITMNICIDKNYTLKIKSFLNIKLKSQAVSSVVGCKTFNFQEEWRYYKSTPISINYSVRVYKFQLPYQIYNTWLQHKKY